MLQLALAVLIEGVTLISPERGAPVPHTDVLIRDGRIAQIGRHLAVGSDVQRIDGRGRYLIPGLIDTHTHPESQGPLDEDAIEKHPELLEAYRTQLPRSYLAFGFTSIVDVDLRGSTVQWFNAAPLHPTLLHCGRGVHVAGGYGAQRVPKDAAAASAANLVYQPTTEWPAYLDPKDFTPARAIDRVVASGGVCVKTFVESGFGGAAHWPVPTAQTLAALRAEATKRGLVFVVHANAVESWQAAIGAHADVIAHGLWHWPGEWGNATPPQSARDVIRAAARANIAVQPTLQAVVGDLAIFDPSAMNDPRFAEALPPSVIAYLKGSEGQAAHAAMADEYRGIISRVLKMTDPLAAMSIAPARAKATLRLMLADHVKLLLGSDTPSNEGIGNPPGLNGRLEMSQWAEAGVPLARIFRAATLDNARMFHLDDRGTIEVGKRADLLLLRMNPLESAKAYDTIETVILNGQPIPRASLVSQN
jgi:imidazolonepropionase-like amidohydrolase